ncbi:hypothetical protein Godav_020614 [Gossypium davidsonii]|uniref:Phytosulfokine n=2 Tax=Gossypium TaxID=3633 RepID=A0A7J9BFS7_GOSGO|nr:hypothetical protein [Gossypium davidsonii]MBA0735024.1 hypothetical protein [Gossypium gossypioides]
MAKLLATLFILTLFVSTLSFAARTAPPFPANTQQQEAQGVVEVEDSCEGVAEEECLMRRTLAAHTDYIYTQNHNP